MLTDLAVIMCVAALTTVIFRRIHQPVVLGYLLAGLLIGPHTPVPLFADKELAEISALLADPACRLLTLVGPGGIGKTRLAIQAASRLSETFADGVFKPAAPVSRTFKIK